MQKLKERAAKNGVSAEEEHRQILVDAPNGHGGEKRIASFKEMLLAMPNVGEDEDFARIEGNIRDVDLSD